MEKIISNKVSATDVERATLQKEAYNKGLLDGKRFATFYVLEAIRNARFNLRSERMKLSKTAYFILSLLLKEEL